MTYRTPSIEAISTELYKINGLYRSPGASEYGAVSEAEEALEESDDLLSVLTKDGVTAYKAIKRVGGGAGGGQGGGGWAGSGGRGGGDQTREVPILEPPSEKLRMGIDLASFQATLNGLLEKLVANLKLTTDETVARQTEDRLKVEKQTLETTSTRLSNKIQKNLKAMRKAAENRAIMKIVTWVMVGLAVVAAAVACIVVFMGKDGDVTVKKSDKKPTKIKTVKPVSVTNAIMTKVATNAEEKLPPWQDKFVVDRKKRMAYSKLIEARTNEAGMVTERFRLPNGQTWRRVTDPPPIFRNPSDCAIAMSLGDGSGAPIPPVPGLNDANLNEEFVKSLLEPIVVDPKDSPRVAALKMAVKSARSEIAQMIKNGDDRTVGQILADHISLNNHQADMQAEAIKQVNQVRREEGDAAADEYLVKVNENLKAYGIAPVGQGRRRGQEGREAKQEVQQDANEEGEVKE